MFGYIFLGYKKNGCYQNGVFAQISTTLWATKGQKPTKLTKLSTEVATEITFGIPKPRAESERQLAPEINTFCSIRLFVRCQYAWHGMM